MPDEAPSRSEAVRAREDVASLDGFTPTDEHRALCTELGHDVEKLLTGWRLHRKANGIDPVDLDADFERWIRMEAGFQRAEPRGPTPLPSVPWTKPDDTPPTAPATRKAGLELVKASLGGSNGNGGKQLKAPPSSAVPETVEDPAVIREREESRQRQLATLRRPVKT